jgi:Ser-tRNA(Ala) deacylase AlaX
MEYNGVRMELGLEDSDEANSDDIISLYNELVEEGTPLISYIISNQIFRFR